MLCLASLTQVFEGRYKWVMLSCHTPRVNKSQPQNYQVGAPMDRVATDILGPFPQSESDNSYLLQVGDYFTRWIEAYAIPEFSAKIVAQKLVYEFFSRFGTPFDLHSDQGCNYESQLFKEVCKLLHPIIHSPMV